MYQWQIFCSYSNVCRQIQFFILWSYLTWCLLEGFGKKLQTGLLDVGETCVFGWNWLLGRSLYVYVWEEILVVWLCRGRHLTVQDKRLSPMILSQAVLWGTASVVICFWRAIKDYRLLPLLYRESQMSWTKWLLSLLFWQNFLHLRNIALQLILVPFVSLFHAVWELMQS